LPDDLAMGPERAADDVRFRILEPAEGARLCAAIRAAYGDSYDADWVYDEGEVCGRIAAGTYVSCVAESSDGALLCHVGVSLGSPSDRVGHSGQAVTLPAARGQHLFTRTKRHLIDWARSAGLAGMYSEATAAHPYSQRANVDLGAQETGFLLGWIPASVTNDAATAAGRRRQSAALFYIKTNDGDDRPVFAPPRHRRIVRRIIESCGLRGRPAEPPRDASLPERTAFHVDLRADHNLALITVAEPGADLEAVLSAERRHLLHHGLDAVYVDLPLETAATALVSEHLERLGLSFAGVFPNTRADGDVLRMQSLHGVTVDPADVAVASDHGRELLDYVLADLAGR
jgi:GNAT superfamily N-acetyltransferase